MQEWLKYNQKISFALRRVKGHNVVMSFEVSGRHQSLPTVWLSRRALSWRGALPVFAVTLYFAILSGGVPEEGSVPGFGHAVLSTALYILVSVGSLLVGMGVDRSSFRRIYSIRGGERGLWYAIHRGIYYGVMIIVPAMLISILSGAVLSMLGYEEPLQDIFECLADEKSTAGVRVVLGVSAVVVAPVVEELVFRGVIFASLLRYCSLPMAVLISGVYFAAVHLHVTSFPALVFLGCTFATGYAVTGSILTPIIMHTLFNSFSLSLFSLTSY